MLLSRGIHGKNKNKRWGKEIVNWIHFCFLIKLLQAALSHFRFVYLLRERGGEGEFDGRKCLMIDREKKEFYF